jgi:hypothetical protein
MVNLNKNKASTENGILFKLPLVFIAFLLLIHIFGKAMRFKATNFSILVLNAKGEKLKAKATGSTTSCEFQKNHYA